MDVKLEKLLALLDVVVALLTGSIRERVAMDCSQEMEILASREVVWVVCRVLCIWQRHAVLLDSYHSMTCVLVMEYRSHRYHSNQSKHQSNAIQCNPMQSNATQCNPLQPKQAWYRDDAAAARQRSNNATSRPRSTRPHHSSLTTRHSLTLPHTPSCEGRTSSYPTNSLTNSLTHL